MVIIIRLRVLDAPLDYLGILGFLIGELTVRINEYMEKKKNGHLGTRFENHYVIIGWNTFAKNVAKQIIHAGHKVA